MSRVDALEELMGVWEEDAKAGAAVFSKRDPKHQRDSINGSSPSRCKWEPPTRGGHPIARDSRLAFFTESPS